LYAVVFDRWLLCASNKLGTSVVGTFRTCRAKLTMSVDRGKADFPPQGRDFRF
jgi:hypothetical protein